MVKKKKQRNAHKIARTMAATLVLGNTVLTPISTFAATNSNLDVVESLSVAENWDNLQKENEEAVLPNAPQDSEINSDIASKAGVHMRFRGRSNLSFLVGTTVTREDILNISRPRYVKNAAFLNYPKSESKWRANLTGLDTNKVGRYSIPIDFNGVASGHAGNGNLAGIYGYVTVNMVDRESNDSDITFANQTIVLTPTNEFDDDIKKVINPSTSYRHVDDDSKSTESGNDVTWNDFDWDISELDLTTPGTYTVPISVNKVKMNINGDRQQYAKGTAEVTVVIVDEEVAEDAAPITVNYADEDGKKLTDSEKLTGKVGGRYNTEAKGFDGYVLKETPPNATGLFSEEAKTVTYVYVAEEGAPVTVEHVDENGDSLLSSEILTGKIGSEYTSDAKEIEGYTLKETPSNATGTFTDKEQTITYVYEVAQGADVKVEYVDEDGKELVDSETLTGKIGAEYMTEAKEVEGYSLKETPSNATGTFAKEAQTVKYVYEVTEGAPITVRYVDENGEDLLQPLTVTGKIGEKYTSEAKNIADYRFKEVPSNGTVTFSKEEQTVTYVYEVRPWDEMSFITDTVTYEVGTEIDSAEIISQIRPEAVARDMFGNIVSDTANQKYFHADLSEVNMNQPGVYTVRITNDRNGDHDNFYGPSTTPYDMYVKAEGYITINVEAEDAEEDREEVETYNQFKLGYWRGFGFVLEGAAGLDGVTFDTKESVKKTVEIVNGDDEVVQSIAAVNTNWYDSSNYDGYQAILTADILGSLAEGSYRMQVRIEVDGEEYVSTITEQLASTRGILSGEYQNSIANIETRYAHGNQIQFGNVMNQMVLSVTSQAGEWNTLVDYRLSDGTRVIDAWIATDFDYSQEHTKELVVRDKENNEVERTKASTWNIREVFNVPVKAEWERAGVQVLIAPEYQTNDYTCYVVVSDASGEEVIEVEIAL